MSGFNKHLRLENLTRWYLKTPRWRFVIECFAWFGLVSVIWTLDTLTKFQERWRIGAGLDDFRLIAEQVTSATSVLVMLFLLRYWTRLFVFRFDKMGYLGFGVIFGSCLFAFGHYNLMIMQRFILYPFFGESWVFSNYYWNLWFEWQKDIKIVLIAWGFMWLYRRWIYQLSLKMNDKPMKIFAQTGTGDIWIAADDIVAIEAAKNYATLILKDRECIVRSTLAQLVLKLSEFGFIQVHRSYLVKVDAIEKVERSGSNTMLKMSNGSEIPVSRTFKPTLKNAIGNILSQ